MTDMEVGVVERDTERQVLDAGRVRREIRRVGDAVMIYHNGAPTSDPIEYPSADGARAAYAVAVMELLDDTRDPWVVRHLGDDVQQPVMQTMYATMLEVARCREGHPVPSVRDRAKVVYEHMFGHVTLPPDEFWHLCQKIVTALELVQP